MAGRQEGLHHDRAPLTFQAVNSSSSFHPWLGVFETLRVDQGRAHFVEEHWTRLNEAAAALGLTVPVDFREAVAALPPKTGRWRWIVAADWAKELFEEESFSGPQRFSLALTGHRIGEQNWDARYKTFSYLTHWQARQAALAAGADEALLLNQREQAASGAMTNLFWVSGGVLHTPSVEAGCRDGVVRNWVMGQKETSLVQAHVGDLFNADEIFLTNSLIGIKPVTKFSFRELAVGPVTDDLMTRYRATIS